MSGLHARERRKKERRARKSRWRLLAKKRASAAKKGGARTIERHEGVPKVELGLLWLAGQLRERHDLGLERRVLLALRARRAGAAGAALTARGARRGGVDGVDGGDGAAHRGAHGKRRLVTTCGSVKAAETAK